MSDDASDGWIYFQKQSHKNVLLKKCYVKFRKITRKTSAMVCFFGKVAGP